MSSTRRLAVLFGLGCLAVCRFAGASPAAQTPAAQPSVQEATRANASGLLKARNRDFDGAISDYSEAIRLDPTFADAFYNRGLAKAGKGDLDGAIEDYSQTIVVDPRHARAYYSRGVAYARKRDYDRAIESFSHGLEIAPTNANAYDDRGLAKANKGDVEGAISDLNTAVSLDPRNARAFLNRGFAKSKKSDNDGALADYSEAIRLNGSYTLAYINRGRTKTRKNDLEGAIADFNQAISLEPNNATAYFERGLARQRGGDQNAANLDFSRASTLDPKLTRPAAGPPPVVSSGGATGVAAQLPPPADGPYRPGGGVTVPKVVREVKPRYTAEAMRAKIHGSVLLECVVAIDGSVSDARVVRTLDPGLDAEAIKAAEQWRFDPGTKDGKPVPVRVVIELTFTLRDEPANATPAVPSAAQSDPAPFSLPAPFTLSQNSSASPADDQWQERIVDAPMLRVRIRYPTGWTATTGIAGNTIGFQNQLQHFGVAIATSADAQIPSIAQPLSAGTLKLLLDGVVQTTGLPPAGVGQTKVGDRLWLWIDTGNVSVANLEKIPQFSASFVKGLVKAARAWVFFGGVGGQRLGVVFYVVNTVATTDDEYNRVIEAAGPIFARILEKMSFEMR